MSNLRPHRYDAQIALPMPPRHKLGEVLVDMGTISPADLDDALKLQRHIDAPLGDILVSKGLAAPTHILAALAQHENMQIADLDTDPPEFGIASELPASLCLKYRVVPWREIAGILLVATNRPDQFDRFRACMGAKGKRCCPVLAEGGQIKQQLNRLYGSELAQKAATRVPAAESCRAWEVNPQRRLLWAWAVAALIGMGLLWAPLWVVTICMVWALITLLMTTVLKAAALHVQVKHQLLDRRNALPPPATAPFPLPKVSVLVPLLREKEIARALIKRLSRLTYPKSLLEVVLVLEQSDTVTRDTLARTELPHWISVIEVPAANRLTTKPRAMNYALDFCNGSLIGVWDAEDAPEPDQLEKVVSHFQRAPRNVACLQGVLDYYNSKTNWLSRCFTIEYATWWRMMMPGVERLGLVVPLGGTTLFFRRDILEKLCGWDAHNVTEDADLGVRLARHGYTTQLIDTATFEEANCRAWPWVRQRSRWLKGFLITWCVHMRDPAALLKDLGWKRFLGVQTLFFATFSQFALAPFLLSFWLTLFGMTHPVELTLGTTAMWVMIGFFILAETINLGIAAFAVRGAEHRHLLGWVLTLPFYFPMGALAAYKGLHEFVVSPFFWDKTQHGYAGEEKGFEVTEPLIFQTPARPVSTLS